jgi:signal transduction histidine kinase
VERLQQVFWNLLSNAVKFTPHGGLIDVYLERSDSLAEVRIEDSGPGVPPEFLPHIFERFSQADGSSTRKHGGLGLGLAIVRHLVEIHGGTVSATNREAESGAILTVRLPAVSRKDAK